MSLLDGKKGLVLNLANDRSIAWHIGRCAINQGAKVGFGYLPLPRAERRVRNAMEEGGFGNAWLAPCDVSKDEDIERFFAAARQEFGEIDFLVHCLAYANREYLQMGRFLATPRDVFAQAMDISAYSLIALARAAAPLMPRGGAMVALSYLGGDRAVPGYNVMGVAKAALESATRYLAMDLGPKKIRVNVISAGPMRTLSAMAVDGIDEAFEHVKHKSPLKRNIEGDEVGMTAVYLVSDLSTGVTGEKVFVDSGYHMVGI
ncbi:MAG TPA: enoyl-ACP reductase [Tepidisphaeraceae bacterium]|nr:enoyl-ACP reductase [Tepidisphaeraceae bacterium]